MLRLYLVRHGVTAWNREARMQGHADIPLAEEGVEQARRLSTRLARERIDAVWSSDLARARRTAEAIAAPHGLAVVTTALLREQSLGAWEGLTQEEIVLRGEGALLRAYRQDSIAHRPPGSEPLTEVWDRLLRSLEAIRRAHPSGTVVVVGHGGSLRVLLCDALAAPLPTIRRIWLDNASLSLIEYAEDRPRVRLMNDTGHLRMEEDRGGASVYRVPV